MIVPFMLLIAQLQFHYGYEGLEVGDRTLLVVDLAADSESVAAGEAVPRPLVEVEAPPGVAVETDSVWIPSLRQVVWRLRAEEPGDHELTVRTEAARRSRRVCSSPIPKTGARRVSSVTHAPPGGHPRSAALSRGALASPRRADREDRPFSTPQPPISFFGLLDVHWLIAFLVPVGRAGRSL